MPIYAYTCSSCNHAFDHLARTLSDRATKCPKCGAANPKKELAAFAAGVAKPEAGACRSCEAAPRCPHVCSGGCSH